MHHALVQVGEQPLPSPASPYHHAGCSTPRSTCRRACSRPTACATTRRQRLALADGHLSKVRLYLRLAHRWQWLNDGQYEHASRMIAELGRLLGGWQKVS
ncbi:MAG: four helix bundle protein [Anaerolineae bacterium]|nr:MAG: four helix bundle protein [Anaerolineae bacterium]